MRREGTVVPLVHPPPVVHLNDPDIASGFLQRAIEPHNASDVHLLARCRYGREGCGYWRDDDPENLWRISDLDSENLTVRVVGL